MARGGIHQNCQVIWKLKCCPISWLKQCYKSNWTTPWNLLFFFRKIGRSQLGFIVCPSHTLQLPSCKISPGRPSGRGTNMKTREDVIRESWESPLEPHVGNHHLQSKTTQHMQRCKSTNFFYHPNSWHNRSLRTQTRKAYLEDTAVQQWQILCHRQFGTQTPNMKWEISPRAQVYNWIAN